MKGACKLVFAPAFYSLSFTLHAQLQLLPDKEPQRVFAGDKRNITLVWHNVGDMVSDTEIHARMLQTSSATAIQWSETPWKELQVLPQQTALETARLDFPSVRAETKFLIQWLENSNSVAGKTEVLVYPTNLLGVLRATFNEENFGVLDPNDELKPLLKQNGVEFLDLGEMALEDFTGKLAITGPFHSKDQMRDGLAKAIQRIARKGVAVVWLQPPPGPQEEIEPSFYAVPEGRGKVVIVQPELVANLSENPKSQLDLVYFCKLALNPAPPQLPNLSLQP